MRPGIGNLKSLIPTRRESISSSRVYFIVESEIHRQAMDALRHQQDRDSIAQGIAEMESGQGIPLADARKLTRDRLLARER